MKHLRPVLVCTFLLVGANAAHADLIPPDANDTHEDGGHNHDGGHDGDGDAAMACTCTAAPGGSGALAAGLLLGGAALVFTRRRP